MASGNKEFVILDHGSGGRATYELLERVFRPHLRDVLLLDSAILELSSSGRLAFTTDSFVVSPIFFPGGDIGSLAVHGTVNDLAMVGATPLYLSVAFILEEGFSLAELERVVASLAAAAKEAGVKVVCGDTKVVPKGKGDLVYINTTGVGVIPEEISLRPEHIRLGDEVLVSGPVGDHGLAVLSAREGLGLEGLESDSQPLNDLVRHLLEGLGDKLHALRDPTRGGLATTLNELAVEARCEIVLDEARIPVREEVRAGADILGLDPLYLACEGRLIAFVAEGAGEAALSLLQSHPRGKETALIGRVVSQGEKARVILKTAYGGERLLPMLSGEPLPRIC
jgi:hydrogenase expression/formation protein HypE